jgi:hypothetical protein
MLTIALLREARRQLEAAEQIEWVLIVPAACVQAAQEFCGTTVKVIPMIDKFEPAGEGDRPALLGKIGTQEVVSTKAILDAKGPFGAIDALDPGARLRVLIETAQKFRADNPDAPKRASELAVDEVLRQRDEITQLQRVRKHLMSENATAWDTCEALHTRVNQYENELAEIRRPWWQKLIQWFAGFAP